jgi:hypothetical protein
VADIRWREKDGEKIYTAYSTGSDRWMRDTTGDGIVSFKISDDEQIDAFEREAALKGLIIEAE